MDRTELAPLASGDAGILALGIDAHDREGVFEQVGDDRADALATARRRDRQQVSGAGIAQQLARLAVAADQEPHVAGQIACFCIGGETGRAVGVDGVRTAVAQDQGLEERAQRHEQDRDPG